MSIQQQFLDETVKKIMGSFGPASCTISVWDGGREMFSSMGKGNVEASADSGPDSFYAIGSLTKSFTASAIGILADRKMLDLDERVIRYLPDFRMYDDYVAEDLTVRDILSHRSGLPRHEVSWMLNSDFSPEQIVRCVIPHLKPAFPIRYKWNYQNHMYALATVLIETVSGMTFRDFIRENILEPLEMDDTYVYGDEISDDDPRKTAPYMEMSGTFIRLPYDYLKQLAGAGCIWSTARDMMKWLRFSLDGNEMILSHKMRLETQSPQIVIPVNENIPEIQDETYGMGWVIDIYRGAKVINHNGGLPGYGAMQLLVPGMDSAALILMNSASGDALNAAAYMILDELLGSEPYDWPARIKEISSQKDRNYTKEKEAFISRAPGKKISHKDFTGTFCDPAYGRVDFEEKDGELYLRCSFGVFPLTCMDKGEYILSIDAFRANAPVKFNISGEAADSVDMTLEAMLPDDPIRFIKQ